MVIETPADTREQDETAGPQSGGTGNGRQKSRGRQRQRDAEPAARAQMVPEEHGAKCGGGREFEVQPERDGRRRGQVESQKEQNRPEDAANHDGPAQAGAVLAILA